MPRSVRDSDEDVEPKIGRRIRTLTTQSVVDSPIRRSSRIKKSAKSQKSSPGSESDTSVSSNQPARITRQRTATMDSLNTEIRKGRGVRKVSISSETSENVDIDVGTPTKRTTRRSFTATTFNTPTRSSTRVASKHFIRAGSETKSPPPSLRTTRRTRASSVDPETMSDQSKNVSTKTRKRASMLPSQSPVKEEIEEKEHESCIKVDVTLDEVEEFTSSGNNFSMDKIAHSKGNGKIKKIDNTNKNKVEEDNSNDEMILFIASDEASANNEIHSKHTTETIVDKESLDKIQSCTEDLSLDVDVETNDEIFTNNTNITKNVKEDKSKMIASEEHRAGIEDSLIDICKEPYTKELTIRLENIFETSIKEQKKSPSNKENQTLNIVNTSTEKSIEPVITSVTSLSTKSLVTVSANKSLNEKEKFTRNEPSLGKRRRSRESTETAVKYTSMLKKGTDNIEEITDSSADSSNSIIIQEKENLVGDLSINDITKKQSLVHDIDKKSISSLIDDTEIVNKIDGDTFVETISKTDKNVTEIVNILDKSVTNTETCNKVTDNQENTCSLTANDNEMILQLGESNESQDKKSLNEPMKTIAESNFDHSNESIDVMTCDNKSIAVDKLAPIIQNKTDDLLNSTEQRKKNVSNYKTQSTLESSNTILETINISSNNLNTDNSTVQDIQPDNVTEVPEESTADVPSEEGKSNTSSKVTATSTQQENEDTLAVSVGGKSTQLNRENHENIKEQDQEDTEDMNDDKSDVDIVSMFRDLPVDEWKEDTVETKSAIEGEFSPASMENESEAECDLVLMDKQAWLAAESMKVERNEECFEYDSDDTVLLKSRLDTSQTGSSKKRLSTINETLLINIDDDDEEEEEEAKEEEEAEEEEENKATKPIKTQKSRRIEESEDSSTIYINTDSSNSGDKFLNKSKKDLNRSSNRSVSKLNKSKQTAEEFTKILDTSDDEIRSDIDRLNRSSKTRKNISLRKSTEKRESLNKSLKDTSSRSSFQSTKNNSVTKSQEHKSEEELDNVETYTGRNLKKKKRSLNKLREYNKDADSDDCESEKKKSLLSEESDKEDKDVFINVEDSDANNGNIQSGNLRCKKSDINYSTLALAGSHSNKSSKSNDDDTIEDLLKYHVSSLSKSDSDANNDDDDDDDDDDDGGGKSSIDSDIKREYNLDAVEQEYSDNNVPYDECRTSESEISDPDDTGSDLADFIVADNAIEDEKSEEEQNDENDEQEREEDEAAEEVEDNDSGDEQMEYAEEEEEEEDGDDSTHAEEDEDKQSAKIKISASKTNASDKLLDTSKNKRKISIEHTVSYQSKNNEDIKVKESHTKKVEETNILDTSDSTLPIKKKRISSYIDETGKESIKLLNESEINRRKFSKATHTSVECSTPKINSSKEEFVNDVEIAAASLEAADEKSNSMSETKHRKKRKSQKDFILKENLSFKEPKDTNNKEKLLHTSLPSDLLERVDTRPTSKRIKLNRTMNVTHTETPTIRDLRKEKLNESAPELTLKIDTSQFQKRRLSKEGNIVQNKNEINNDEEMSNLVALFNDNIQEPSQRKQKKHKRTEKMLDENITENIILSATESDISKQQKKKKKRDELDQISTIEDTIRKNACQLVDKKKKKKINIMNENVKENDVQQKDIHRKEKGTLHTVKDEPQHNKKERKKGKIVSNIECDNIPSRENVMTVKKKTKWQETEDSKETLELKESLKKKKQKEKERVKEEENILSTHTKVLTSKLKSAKKTESKKLQSQNISLPKTVELKNEAFIKARNEAMEAIKCATERIKLNKKLKKKKREDNANTIQEQDAEVPTKRRKTEKHFEEKKQMLPSSTTGLKRLSDNVIDKLSDVPTQVKKRKLSQNTGQVIPSLSTKNPKFLETKVKKKNFIQLSSNGGTTQFAIINMSKPKKQPPKTIASVMSYRQRMLNRNNREPVSSYLMYLQKQKSAKDGFPNNAF